MPKSFNYQLTIDLQNGLQKALSAELYKRLSYIWVGKEGLRYVSWDRSWTGPRDAGASMCFNGATTVKEIVTYLTNVMV